MPFKSQMGLPTELTLRDTPDGPRLFNKLVNEVDLLQGAVRVNSKNLTADEASRLLKPFDSAGTLRIKTTLRLSHATGAGLNLFGQPLLQYDLNYNLLNGAFYSPVDMTSMEISADIILDKTSVEVFVNDGHFSYCLERKPREGNQEGFRFWGKEIEIKALEVLEMRSIW